MKFFRSLQSHIYIVTILISFLGFIILNIIIHKNSIQFYSDELYWIQTARILPYIQKGNLSTQYWHENMGFTNFNGAKWVYAIGLALFGHTNFEKIGIPPETYYKWNSYEGSPFPQNHELYMLLHHGRIINSVMASLALGLLFLLTFQISNNIFTSVLTVIIFIFHPIFQIISLHAFADSTFIVGELCIFYLLLYCLHSMSRIKKIWFYVLIGIVLSFTISTKINGYMFTFIVLGTIIFQNYKNRLQNSETIIRILFVCVTMIITFIILNPNLLFYKTYSLFMMIQDRILITKIHMTYFSKIDPAHVLNTFSARIISFCRHIFTFPIFIGINLSLLSLFYARNREFILRRYRKFIVYTLYILCALLTYVVFDEERYYLPILPFVCILSSMWVDILFQMSETTGRN